MEEHSSGEEIGGRVSQLFGLYPYAPEKSFGMGELCRALETAGFEVEETDGILFYPGLWRMIDVVLQMKAPILSRLFAPTVWPFEFLSKRLAAARRHGYLICARVRRPR